MQYSEEWITPEIAEEWLKKNKVNRKINYHRFNQYAKDMKNGDWQTNGEAIKFYEDGSLADGQHRLRAIITADVSVKLSVIRGLPLDVTIQDRGRNRSLTDSMVMEGAPARLANNTNVGICRLHYFVQKGNSFVSDGTIRDFLYKNEKLLLKLTDIAKASSSGRKTGVLNTRNAVIMLPCFYAIKSGEVPTETIADFLRVLYSGIPDSLDQSAALVCRNDILSGAIQVGGGGSVRKAAVTKIEKAISDFSAHYRRKISYSAWATPIYSVHANNQIEEVK